MLPPSSSSSSNEESWTKEKLLSCLTNNFYINLNYLSLTSTSIFLTLPSSFPLLSPVYVAAVVVVVIAPFFNLSYTSGLTYSFTMEWRACQQTSSHVSERTHHLFFYTLWFSHLSKTLRSARAQLPIFNSS